MAEKPQLDTLTEIRLFESQESIRRQRPLWSSLTVKEMIRILNLHVNSRIELGHKLKSTISRWALL